VIYRALRQPVFESQLEVQAYLFINDVISDFYHMNVDFEKSEVIQPCSLSLA